MNKNYLLISNSSLRFALMMRPFASSFLHGNLARKIIATQIKTTTAADPTAIPTIAPVDRLEPPPDGCVGGFERVGSQFGVLVGHVCGGIFVGGHDCVGVKPDHVCVPGHSPPFLEETNAKKKEKNI